MDQFCGSTFWDANQTWYTDHPELSTCFEKTVLVWVPCGMLWLCSAFEAYYVLHSKEKNIPWNILSILKLVGTCVLIVLTLVDLGVTVHRSSKGDQVFDVDYYSPIIKILTFCLAGTLMYYNRKYGLRASGVLFFFWLLFCLAAIPQLRTEIRTHAQAAPDEAEVYPLASYLVFYPLLVFMFILSCFADLPPRDSPYQYEKNQCPEKASGYLQRLTFSWFDPLTYAGYKRDLTEEDLWALNPSESSKEIVPLFDKYWQRSLAKRQASLNLKATYRKSSAAVDIKDQKERKPASILPALCLSFGPEFLFGSFLKLINDLLTFVSPQLLKYLIGFVNDQSVPMWKGYLYAALLLVTAIAQTALLAHYFIRMYVVGMKVRTALTSAVYRKSLVMSNAARKESTVGEIVNLMAVDAQRFLELMAYLNIIWSAPLQIALALYFLWAELGPSVLAGLAVMVILIPVNGLIANRVKVLQIKQMKYKDERVKLMNEILNGIKVLKMYAWEKSFEEQILKIRNKEMVVLKQQAYLNSATSFIWTCAPFLVTFLTFFSYVMSSSEHILTTEKIFVSMSLFLTMNLPLGLLPIIVVYTIEVSLVSFGCFVLIDDKNVLDSKRVFVAVALFNILRFPLSMLPNVISNVIQTSVGIKRLNKFLNCEELDKNAVSHEQKESNPLSICQGYFSWGEDAILKDINMSVTQGSLVAVVGTVGSGKSSLLSALLGEMNKTSGHVNTRGSTAYVPQQAWIQNATLQDNILFGKELDKRRYEQVVEVCALKTDFDILPGGDQTEIGEKGINLSGGQKQRVSLARAVYHDTDNYLLDDPLSAVDSHVGKHIFDNVLGPNGLLKKKTRVLVTHGITYLPKTDYIYVLKDGEISESGTYQELVDKKGAFADFLFHHLTETTATDGSEEMDIIKQQLESKLGTENFRDKLQRARSLSESASESEQPSAGDRKDSAVRKRTSETPIPTKEELKEKNKLIETEKTETGSVKWSVYKHYLSSVGLTASLVTILMNLVLQGFQIGSNYWLTIWSDDNTTVVDGHMVASKRDMYLGVYGALGFGQAVSVCAAALALYQGAIRAAILLHGRLVRGVLRAPLGFYNRTPTGRVLSRAAKDVDVVDTQVARVMYDTASTFVRVLGTVVVISISTPIFMTAILPIAVAYYLIQRFYVATSRQLKRLESVSRSPIYSHFGESITGAPTIRAYGVADRFIAESERGVDYNQACYYPSCVANRWLSVRLEMIGNAIIFLASMFAVLARGGPITGGLVGLSISSALQITQTLNWLVRMSSEVETNIVAVERIKEYAETEQEAAWEIAETAPSPDWPSSGAVELEGLVLAYREHSDPVLRSVTCVVRPGDKVGIVGRTGAGKSTLTLGLFRIIEALKGKILIDGVDISKIGLHQLRSRITIIPQDPVLFSGSLRMNLDPFEAFTDAAVWRALEHAHLKTFVQGLAAGLRHGIAEGGENLSVGQRQLVCLARALLRKTPLLVLDEATAAVDLETDELIQRTIRREFASCTVLTIAHRLNTIMDSTRVMVLERGVLVEYAPPADLLRDPSSLFHAMAKDAGLVG